MLGTGTSTDSQRGALARGERLMVERAQPRMSLNALTEYLAANAARRKRIVEEQKRPNDFQVIYYQPAQDAIVRFLVDGGTDESLLVQEMERLDLLMPQNEYEEHRWPSNIEALQAFLDFYEELDFQNLELQAGNSDQPRLTYSGLSLSVRPEILMYGSLPRHGQVVGALKLYFTKNERLFLNSTTGQYPASILYEFLCQHHASAKSLHRLCFMVDVFGKTIHVAPRSYRRLLNDVEAACQEIQSWWSHV